MDKPTEVLLRDLDAPGQQTKPFSPEHAKRLLAYPNTRWAEVTEDAPKTKLPRPGLPGVGALQPPALT